MFYNLIAGLCRPAAWWGRLRIEGLDVVPPDGPLLVVPNHDSQWDPILVGLAIYPRRRLRFLARSGLWRIPGLAPILNGLGQIPIRRGRRDEAALARALGILRGGGALTVFPEGRLSWGEPVRARSGVGLLATWCREARIVLCTIEGTTDYVRFPKRPLVTVRFFEPAAGLSRADSPAALATRLLTELRTHVPPCPAGRRAIVGGPPRIQRRLARRRLPSPE
ncbi:MAG: lysophospholipid acyltransferase family protein [Acidobacteriota bacterium]